MAVQVGSAVDATALAAVPDPYGPPYPISVPLIVGPATQQLIAGPGAFAGWSIIETTGAQPATVELYDGFDTGAQLFMVFNVQVGASTQPSIMTDGMPFTEGLFLNVVTGSIRGVVYVRSRRH